MLTAHTSGQVVEKRSYFSGSGRTVLGEKSSLKKGSSVFSVVAPATFGPIGFTSLTSLKQRRNVDKVHPRRASVKQW